MARAGATPGEDLPRKAATVTATSGANSSPWTEAVTYALATFIKK